MKELLFNLLKDFNLEELRSNHARIYYFGLGFIQLKLNEEYRLHFYTPELPAFTDDVHNHRYHFFSKILSGYITNNLYEVVPGDSHIMNNESCNADIKAPKLERPCSVILMSSKTYYAGDLYYMPEDKFHTVQATECITLLKRSEYTKEYAQVITPVGRPSICPFSKKIPEDDLWDIIREML